MNSEVRKYLAELVRQIQMRANNRGGISRLKRWEKRLLDGAMKLLRENQTDLPLGGGHDYTSSRITDAELNEQVRRHSHAGFV